MAQVGEGTRMDTEEGTSIPLLITTEEEVMVRAATEEAATIIPHLEQERTMECLQLNKATTIITIKDTINSNSPMEHIPREAMTRMRCSNHTTNRHRYLLPTLISRIQLDPHQHPSKYLLISHLPQCMQTLRFNLLLLGVLLQDSIMLLLRAGTLLPKISWELHLQVLLHIMATFTLKEHLRL